MQVELNRPGHGRGAVLRLWGVILLGFGLLLSVGCAGAPRSTSGPAVIFLDGAGWSGSQRSVRAALDAGGFDGHVEVFRWTTLLGPGPDHLWVGPKRRKAKQLARRIEERRRRHPNDDLHVMGLSAGAAVVVFALEQLPANVSVNNVVLLAPSIAEEYDLSAALEHVGGYLYATSSPRDGILSPLRLTADGRSGQPAGLFGLRIPSRVKRYDLYTRVVNLPWRPAYADLGWNGSHTGATGKEFVQRVIAPRLLSDGAHPLNRTLVPSWVSRWRGPRSTKPNQ